MKPKLEPIAHYRKRLERWKWKHRITVEFYSAVVITKCWSVINKGSPVIAWGNNLQKALDSLAFLAHLPSPKKRRRAG